MGVRIFDKPKKIDENWFSCGNRAHKHKDKESASICIEKRKLYWGNYAERNDPNIILNYLTRYINGEKAFIIMNDWGVTRQLMHLKFKKMKMKICIILMRHKLYNQCLNGDDENWVKIIENFNKNFTFISSKHSLNGFQYTTTDYFKDSQEREK